MTERDKVSKFGPIEVLIVAVVCLFLLAVVLVGGRRSRFDAYRITCGKNLSVIGKAMLAYANDYDGEFPQSAQGTISSCLYLLVKYEGVAPKTFVCPGDAGTTPFNPAEAGVGDRKLMDFWDFGPEPQRHSSYAYHMPFSLFYLTTSSEPGMPVVADRNPWIDSPAAEAKDNFIFNPDGDRESVNVANAITHNEEGQNVLFLDGHVSFEEDPFCGVEEDNIYTSWDGGDVRRGLRPQVASRPMHKLDSLLVHDSRLFSVTGRVLTPKQLTSVNSADLKQTSVVATLECPMPDHKNTIWCSTFQMTWDKLKNEIIGEPVELPEAEQLAARLNQAEFSPRNLESESFYAAVGMVEKGIVGQIQKEMGRRFPSEPVPVFDELDVLPAYDRAKSIVSYSYLKTDIRFKCPFYTRNDAFAFEDSSGQRTNVKSFCDYAKTEDSNEDLVREQVDILYYRYADQQSAAEFAVDLCQHARPYQVVLALVPRDGTLSEILAAVELKISAFKNDPDYETLCKLRDASGSRPADKLIVPDVLYKLTHHFADLEGKRLGNEPWSWRGYYIFEAMQVIDFALSRSGVVLKSEARLIAAPFARSPRQLEEPRYFYFNKPFLIYVKKRGPDYSPFFVMWVDNAELMKAF